MSKRLMQTDLNLLVILNALQETGSTVAAAERIGRTQSAVSLALGRLRDMFSDPMFVRTGNRLVPSPLCLQLKQPVQHILSELLTMVDVGYGFDPKASHRRATFAFPDNALAWALKMKSTIEAAAPNVTLDLVGTDLVTADYEKGIQDLLTGQVDLVLSFYRSSVPNGLELIPLASQRWITLAAADHMISVEPDPHEWCKYEHIQVGSGSTGRDPISDVLAGLSLKRQVSLKLDNFLQALTVATMSEFLFTTMSPVILPLADQLGLRKIVTPIDVPAVPMALICRARRFDPFSKWLADHCTEITKTPH